MTRIDTPSGEKEESANRIASERHDVFRCQRRPGDTGWENTIYWRHPLVFIHKSERRCPRVVETVFVELANGSKKRNPRLDASSIRARNPLRVGRP